MKRLLSVVLFLFAWPVYAQEVTLGYSLPPGGSANYLVVHAYPGCVPTVNSLTSGSINVATWLIFVGDHTVTAKAFNIGGATETSALTLRLGC